MAAIDYKEKYEQAMERARQFFEKPYLEDSAGIVEYIFPELTESEDEKMANIIRESLANVTSENKLGEYGLSHKDVSDWLEKQGEHANFLNKIQIGDKVTRNRDGVLVNLSQLKRVAKPANVESKEQGEQKPAEWSKEDETMINCCLGAVNTTDYFDEDNKDKMKNWLKSLRPQSQWKPSDEQMEYLAKAITTLGDEGNCKTASILNDLRVELKKLRGE